MIFGRRFGIRAEMSSRMVVKDGVRGTVTYAFHSWESAFVFSEDKVRKFFREWKLIPFKIYIPVLATPNGIPMFASPYLFAIAIDATSSSEKNTAGTTWSVAHTISGSNTILWVGSGTDASGNLTADYNGTAMTLAVEESATAFRTRLLYIVAPTTGTNNINFTRANGAGTIDTMNASYSGAKQTGVPDATATNTTKTASPIASNITTVAANCWIVEMCSLFGTDYGGPTSQAAGTNTFKRQASANPQLWDLYDTNAAVAAGVNTMNVTYVGTLGATISISIASFAPVAPAGPANLKSYNTNVKSNIKSIDTNLIANVKSLDTNV